MSPSPAAAGTSPGDGELVLRRRGGGLLAALGRISALTRAGVRAGARRLCAPEDRRRAAQIGAGVVLLLGAAGGVLLLRRWILALRGVAVAVAAGPKRVGRAVIAVSAGARTGAAAVAGAGRFAVSLRWLMWLARGIGASRLGGGGTRRAVRCRQCHARTRRDARVCWRCGTHDLHGRRAWGGAPLAVLRWIWRVLTLSLYRRCPACRRPVHAEARRCHRCGCQLRRRPAE